MSVPGKPNDETHRLDILRALHILDTEPEEIFDRIVHLAAGILGVPMALISLVDGDRQWFKARHGVSLQETSREVSFCAHAILGRETMVVPDASRDSRFCDNRLVQGDPHIAFYAGYPLNIVGGVRVGTLCALDRRPRKVTRRQLEALETLGWIVERELEQRFFIVEQQRRSDVKTRFLAQLGHELRTPTNALLGGLELTRRASAEGREASSFLSIAEGAARQIESMLEDVVDLAQAEFDYVEPTVAQFDLDALVSRLAGQARVECEEKRLRFSLFCEQSLPNAVVGDEKRVGKLISKLLSNAARHTDAGGVELSVDCIPCSEEGMIRLRVEVADTGGAVGEETLSTLFKSTNHPQRPPRMAPDGLGLQLAVCRTLAECLGGSLDVTRNDPGDVALRFELGLALAKEQQGAGHAGSTSLREPRAGPLNLLLVEDSPANRAITEAMLRDQPYVVWSAADGEQGLIYAAKQAFDIVLMDVGLPGMDGYECVRHLRELNNQAGARVIAVTAQSLKGDRDRMLATGFDDFLPKPFSKHDLIDMIERYGG